METEWLDVLKQGIESGTWPFAVIIIALLFRSEIPRLLRSIAERVKWIRGPGFEASLSGEGLEALVTPTLESAQTTDLDGLRNYAFSMTNHNMIWLAYVASIRGELTEDIRQGLIDILDVNKDGQEKLFNADSEEEINTAFEAHYEKIKEMFDRLAA